MKTNYHTHTDFCDGRDSPEAMVRAALDRRFDIIGFSAHSLYPFAAEWHLPPRRFREYAACIAALSQAYRGRIAILTGYEADFLPPFSCPDKTAYAALGAEYLIGSVHYLAADGLCDTPDGTVRCGSVGGNAGWFCVDAGAEEVTNGVQALFGGDGKKTVQAYFARVREMLRTCDFDIVGHIDVVRKRNGALRFFDEREGWYRGELEATAKEAARQGVIVEINTGGIARKAIDDVYPSADFLRLLRAYGVPVMINSDAHAAADIDCAFGLAAQRARDAGYRATAYLEGGTVKETPLA
ncbi:histidinol-phosphatase [Treponema endosymbiont of Eucomonympha sp.]|uniref:histidinol-phosphatase n=1 Tax=Treponema endosymbiont of Eucomonympha sp. TaxID=1580831 RepID=UPI000785B51C|nr:histidinol-phosphatase [Treponema endosymbiont of Eucomonympha sp.]